MVINTCEKSISSGQPHVGCISGTTTAVAAVSFCVRFATNRLQCSISRVWMIGVCHVRVWRYLNDRARFEVCADQSPVVFHPKAPVRGRWIVHHLEERCRSRRLVPGAPLLPFSAAWRRLAARARLRHDSWILCSHVQSTCLHTRVLSAWVLLSCLSLRMIDPFSTID